MRLPILQPCARAIPAFRRYFFRSAGTLSSPELNDSLRRHIAGDNHHASFIPVLEQWKRQGNQLNPSDIRNIIKTLGHSQRFTQALKVSEWMSEHQLCNLIPEDFAARLYLIDNVLGLEEATKFFLSIPECKRDHSVYTTILSFYARSEKTLSMAESIFTKMKVGYLSEPAPFNLMMSLYNQVGKRDMVHKILRQMEMNNVQPDNLTLNIKLRLHVAEFDVEKLRKVLAECKMNTGFTLHWRTSCDIAKVYLRLGLVVTAIKMLRRAEESVLDTKSKKLAYESLMVLYGDAGKAEEVLRIWDLYKDIKDKDSDDWKNKDSEGYRLVISSLLKLGDIYMASKITKEWYDGFYKFDVRIVAMMASAYCETGLIWEAYVLMHNVMLRKFIRDVTIRQWLLILIVLCYLLSSLLSSLRNLV